MINIIPQTEVRLLKTPIEKEGNHTLSFDNINSQTAYFLSKTVKTYTEFTYQRETFELVVPDSFDTINTCNYLMYKNNGFTNKYFVFEPSPYFVIASKIFSVLFSKSPLTNSGAAYLGLPTSLSG